MPIVNPILHVEKLIMTNKCSSDSAKDQLDANNDGTDKSRKHTNRVSEDGLTQPECWPEKTFPPRQRGVHWLAVRCLELRPVKTY